MIIQDVPFHGAVQCKMKLLMMISRNAGGKKKDMVYSVVT